MQNNEIMFWKNDHIWNFGRSIFTLMWSFWIIMIKKKSPWKEKFANFIIFVTLMFQIRFFPVYLLILNNPYKKSEKFLRLQFLILYRSLEWHTFNKYFLLCIYTFIYSITYVIYTKIKKLCFLVTRTKYIPKESHINEIFH